MSHGNDRRPVVAVLAVVVREDRLILVRRANPPDAGLWGFPGGKIEFGETIEGAAIRELREETGVVARPIVVFGAVDAMDESDAPTSHHFVLVTVLCQWIAGDPVAADDATEARWFDMAEILLGGTRFSLSVDTVAARAIAVVAATPG